MPEPGKKESREEYVARFMGSKEAKKSFPDEKQRLAVAYSKWRQKQKKKETTPFFKFIKTKESKDEEIPSTYTFIGANTLPDRTREQLDDGTVIEGEILSKQVLNKFANYINDESRMGGDYGSYRTVSLFHNRVHTGNYNLEEAGYIIPGSAEVLEMKEYPGNYAMYVDVEVNEKFTPPPEYPDYDSEKIHYKIGKGALGLSLEYNNAPEQERFVQFDGKRYRYIMDSEDFRGFGFARPDLIGNPTTIRVKEMLIAKELKLANKKSEGDKTMEETKLKELETNLAEVTTKIKELEEDKKEAEKVGADKKVEELDKKVEEAKKKVEETEDKVKEMKLQMDETAVKLKESIELAFSSVQFKSPAKNIETDRNAKIKEIYNQIEEKNFVKFKEMAEEHIENNSAKLKELFARDGSGFDFEKWQTVQVKCKGSQMIVIPTSKTKDVIDASDMNEATYYQTNAMFADRYVAGITETFLKEDSLLTVLPKEQHIGGNDKYQWRFWTQYQTVTGDTTLSVNPNVTSVARSQRDFIKMETRICEYRDGVEVTDFTQAHSMAAVGDLLGKELQRAAEAVTESMNSDLFKGKTDGTSGWYGFNGLLGFADSATYTSLYGRTRTAALRLLDGTTANTYLSTSEAISVSVVRSGYEKVLAHGSSLGNLVIVMHPTQCRRLFDSEDAAIRNNILTMAGAPATFGFSRSVIPHLDGIPIIRDYRCESSAAAADMFGVIDLSTDKGLNLIISKPLSARGLAKVGTSESAYVSFWGCTVYKSPRNIFVHSGLTAT